MIGVHSEALTVIAVTGEAVSGLFAKKSAMPFAFI